MMNKKAEADSATNLFYVFLTLPTVELPRYFIVPRDAVATFVRESHKNWLATPGRGGRAHVDSDVRNFKDPKGKYLDRWDLLGLE